MVFFIIGLGLGDEKDISIRGLEAIQKCQAVYLEYYTSLLGVEVDVLVCLLQFHLFYVTSILYSYFILIYLTCASCLGEILWSPNHYRG